MKKLWRKFWDWIDLHANAIMFMFVLMVILVIQAVNGGYAIGYEKGYAASHPETQCLCQNCRP